MDRRPRQPRQLAGEYGSSDGQANFDAGGLAGARLFAGDDAVRSCKSLDDPVNADRPADVAFKPKCLGISSSIQIDTACRALSLG